MVKPDQVIKLLALIARIQVDETGEKQAACRYLIISRAGCCFLMITCSLLCVGRGRNAESGGSCPEGECSSFGSGNLTGAAAGCSAVQAACMTTCTAVGLATAAAPIP